MYFALYKDGNSGYFKLTPTNANYRGSKELWNTTEINYLYYDGSSVGISSSYNNSNKSSWYVVMHNDGKYFILNRYYPNVALNWFLGNPSVSTGEVSFSSVSHKWEFIPVGLDVPLIKQEPNYCGPCTILQVLSYLSIDGFTNPNSYSDLQGNIWPYVKYYNGDEWVSKQTLMADYMNNYLVSKQYQYITASNLSPCNMEQMNTLIDNNIKSGYPVIASVKPKNNLTAYYPSNYQYGGHYIVVIGYDSSISSYILRDCNNTTSLVCFGEFVVPAEQLYNASFLNSRGIIY